MRRAQPRCPVSSQKRRIFCLEKARAFPGLIFPKDQELGRRQPRDGTAQTVAAGRELAERAEDETHDGVCIRSVKGAVLQELGLDRPHRAPRRPVDLVVQRASP
jgi:hypothetical protein